MWGFERLIEISNNLPDVITGIILLILGFVFGKISKKIIVKFGEITKLDKLSSGTDKLIHKVGYFGTTFEFIGDIVKWVIYLVSAGGAFQIIFGEQLISQAVGVFMTYLPKVALATIIILLGLLVGDILGNFVSKLINKSSMSLREKGFLASISSFFVKVLSVLFAAAIAFDLISIYPEIFTVVFATIFVAITLFILIGTKDLAINFFAGLYLQSTSDFRKGMHVEVSGKKGTIKEIGAIYTTISSGKGEIQIPNYIFMRQAFVVK